MPTIHIPNNMYPAMDGVSLFTESEKSFIQSVFPVGLIPTASPIAVAVPEAGEHLKLPSHEKICGNPIRRNGIKGTASNPRSRNHRLYCIRLDRLFLNICLAIKRIPMIPLINTLHIKKRIIKLATLIASFLVPLGKKGAESIYFCFRQSVIFYICRQHRSDITVIITFQKRIAFLLPS